MFERPHNLVDQARSGRDSLPPSAGVRMASEMASNAETGPVRIETDERGNMLLPMMQGETPSELPSLPATAEGW